MIAYQGEPGAYSEAAVQARFGSGAGRLPCAGFEQVFAAVADGRAEAGMVPIEAHAQAGYEAKSQALWGASIRRLHRTPVILSALAEGGYINS